MPAPDVATLNQVTRPTATSEGQDAPALRFGDARVMALMAAITRLCHLITVFINHTLVQLMRSLSGEDYSSRQATYDLRRLRRKQIICRIGSKAPTATSSPRPAAQSRSCSPRPTGASSLPAWPPWTCNYPATWPDAAPSHSSGRTSPKNSTDSSTTGWPPPEAET